MSRKKKLNRLRGFYSSLGSHPAAMHSYCLEFEGKKKKSLSFTCRKEKKGGVHIAVSFRINKVVSGRCFFYLTLVFHVMVVKKEKLQRLWPSNEWKQEAYS